MNNSFFFQSNRWKVRKASDFIGWQAYVLLCLLLVGCQDDIVVDPPTRPGHTNGQMQFTVEIPATQIPTRSMDGASEQYVKEIDVLVFDDATKQLDEHLKATISSQAFNSGTNTYEVSFKAGLTAGTTQKEIMIVANERTLLTGLAPAPGTPKLTVLQALTHTLSAGTPWAASGSVQASHTPIPMYGETTVTKVDQSITIPTLSLRRMLARIDVSVDQSSAADFTLEEVYLYNYNTAGYIAPTWNTTTGAVDMTSGAVNIPTVNTPQTGSCLTYNLAILGADVSQSLLGEIYTFESAAALDGSTESDPSRLNATCLVVKGRFTSGPLAEAKDYYYRIDFTYDGTNGSTPGDYMPLLRNYRYIVDITGANGIGYDTAAEALAAYTVPSNLKVRTLYYDEGEFTDIIYNGQYFLAASRDFIEFSREQITPGTDTNANSFYVQTSYETTGGSGKPGDWFIESIIDLSTGSPATWLQATPTSGSAATKTKVLLSTTDANATGITRSAILTLVAGRLRMPIQVDQTQMSRWARSNIVWDGSKLTFATTPTENAIIPANSQGVLFRWGSLVAISPAALSGTTATYTAGQYPSGHIVYDPTNNYAYAWTSIPYISSTAAPFDNSTLTEDDFATYNGGQGWDNTGKGDICRYISSKGWVSGNWRLPTADEYDQLMAEQTSVSNNGGFANIAVSPSTPTTNHYGSYQPLSGRWLGSGATTSSGVGSPTVGAYFPAGGGRGASGTAGGVGLYGYCWSGSSGNTSTGCSLVMNSTGAIRGNSGRQAAFSVRCVRE